SHTSTSGPEKQTTSPMCLLRQVIRQNRLFGKNSGLVAEKYSVATQIAIGGASGWCAGYLIHGYIQVDWKRVEKDVSKAKKQLKKGTNQAVPEFNTLIKGQCYIFQ
uniref:FUN14 domain-containing protein 2 n=1 Tax=Gouania willdenowi TaxID=441366 RepID=A0A8C5HUB3_GOUWI